MAGALYTARDRYVQITKEGGRKGHNERAHTHMKSWIPQDSLLFLIPSRAKHFLQFSVSVTYVILQGNAIAAVCTYIPLYFVLILHSYCSLSRHV